MTTLTHPNGENNTRLELACELIAQARDIGHEVLVAEKYYSENFRAIQALTRAGARGVYRQVGATPGSDRRILFNSALQLISTRNPNFDGVLWTEEKPYMATAIGPMIERMRSRQAVALIPGRTAKSWQSWPWLQRMSEPIGNEFYNRLFGPAEDEPYDPMHGPAYFSKEAVGEVLTFDPRKYDLSDIYIQQFVPIALIAKGLKVASLDIECKYPAAQRTEEEGPKLKEMFDRRLGQLKQIVDGHFALHKALFTKPPQ